MSYPSANSYTFADATGSVQGELHLDPAGPWARGKVVVDGIVHDELTVGAWPLGLLARKQMSVVYDAQTVTLELLLPRVNVDIELEAEPFSGIAVIHTERTSFGGTALVHGALDEYDLRPISGRAQVVRG